MTKEEINKTKYWICCPWCDNEKCVKGTDKCEAEIWAKEKGEQMSDLIKLHDKLDGGEKMNKYTITDEELKIWARLATYAELENDKEAIQLLRKLISREKSWRKLKEGVEKCMNENTKEIAQGIINITENTYSQMLEMFGKLEEVNDGNN